MHIVHIATELAPVAKVGGLADVVHGLSKALVKEGHSIEIILPKYDCINYDLLKNLKVDHRELWSYEGPHRHNNTVWSAEMDGLQLKLIEPHHSKYYFSRGTIYGCPDDIDRFCYFSRAAVEYLYKSGKNPDIIHIHDWPVSLVAPLYKDMYIPLGLKAGGVVLTIHNLEHQGHCTPSHLTRVGLRGESYLTKEKMQDPIMPGMINLLKGGIEYSDFITCVSPNYEKEIQTQACGFGLNEILSKYHYKLKGILNGIDDSYWNPDKDPHLVKHYSTYSIDTEEKLQKVVAAKEENRKQLRTHFGLADKKGPLVASVTRLVPQKGPELIKEAILWTLEKGGQYILLGSIPSEEYEMMFKELHREFSKSKDIAISLDYNEPLAHLIFAGAEMFMIPSIFEPCGLTQLIALRYGTVPIARATGGLVDTVLDFDNSGKPQHLRNGFLFDSPDEAGVHWVLGRAFKYWKDQKDWHQIMKNGMNLDFSWKRTAPQYVEVYQKLLSTPKVLTA